MPDAKIEKVEKQLQQVFGDEMPANPTKDISAALQLAECLEAKGFSFAMKDCCPKSLDDSLWRAVFSKDETKFMAEDAQSAVAICVAAVDALSSE
ncbi:hypothetical protein [Desulfovibrio ferrophilus]|uniref:Phage ABA sandwich domain-containing protein n=1 Tax=Desulfovibrio ferrophilus TaxID=241368 RepID=A0A2Z6AZU7_9BACT|nr:hypothetical protein [Desulfovibrio ferrophilus]BBD08801.1 uncharacterized protein DFE_2075 [Desulfovibrio ferrophilus]